MTWHVMVSVPFIPWMPLCVTRDALFSGPIGEPAGFTKEPGLLHVRRAAAWTLRTVLIPGGCLLHFPIAPFSLSLSFSRVSLARSSAFRRFPSPSQHIRSNSSTPTPPPPHHHQQEVVVPKSPAAACVQMQTNWNWNFKWSGIGKNKKPNFAVFVELAWSVCWTESERERERVRNFDRHYYCLQVSVTFGVANSSVI